MRYDFYMNPVRSHARDKVASPEDLGGATSYGMNKSRIIYSILAILFGIIAISFGAFMFVYGEIDDSPGGQMLGLVLLIIGIVGIIKSKKKTSNQNGSDEQKTCP